MNKGIKATEATSKTYNKVAPFYDFMEGLMERSRYSKWRELLWSKVEGSNILEIGVGTGKNFPYYPTDAQITAIDFSKEMLSRAKEKSKRKGVEVQLRQIDVQNLDFEDDTFDTVVATFVFCSVPFPIKGLKEVEHVLSANRILASLMNVVNPIVVRIMGPNINRRTVKNVANSGLEVEKVTDLAVGIFKMIEARKRSS